MLVLTEPAEQMFPQNIAKLKIIAETPKEPATRAKLPPSDSGYQPYCLFLRSRTKHTGDADGEAFAIHGDRHGYVLRRNHFARQQHA
jgi:hypothetical protein